MSSLSPGFPQRVGQGSNLSSVLVICVVMGKLLSFSLVELSYDYRGSQYYLPRGCCENEELEAWKTKYLSQPIVIGTALDKHLTPREPQAPRCGGLTGR